MPPPVLVGIAGGSGAGKTTVIEEIGTLLPPSSVAVIHHDSYYRDLAHLDPSARVAVNFDHPDSLETSLLVRHLEELRSGRPVPVPIYDFETHTRRPQHRRVDPAEVILLDGILVLADPRVRARLDLRIFVEAAPDVRFIRRLQRDMRDRGRSVESVVRQYLATVRPMHREFVEPSRRHADFVVPEGGAPRAAAEMVLRELRSVQTLRAPGAGDREY